MTYPITWLPGVEDDLDDALTHYLDIRYELMERFAEAFRKTFQTVAAAPLRFAVR